MDHPEGNKLSSSSFTSGIWRKMSIRGVVTLVLWLVFASAVRGQIGSVTVDPVMSEAYTHSDSGTTMYSAYGFLRCDSDEVHAPSTTDEVSAILKAMSAPVRVRVTRRGMHSPAGFVCPGRRASSKFVAGGGAWGEGEDEGVKSVTLLFHALNRVVGADKARLQLTVEAGMTLQELVDAAEGAGMTVPSSAIPIYGNLTVGGVVATSAHGSGAHVKSTLGALVRRVRWVDARGEVLVSETGSSEMAAILGGIGIVGVITELTLQLDAPDGLTVAETHNEIPDAEIARDVRRILKHDTPFMILHWRPDFATYRTMRFKPLAAAAQAPPPRLRARSAYMSPVADDVAGFMSQTLEAWEADPLEAAASADATNAAICTLSHAFLSVPYFVDEDTGERLENLTLPTNRVMLAAECDPKCAYQTQHMGAGLRDVEFTFQLSQLDSLVTDLKALARSELAATQARLDARYGPGKLTACMAPGNFWLRFGASSSALLATNTGEEDVVYIQWNSLDSASSSPEHHQRIEPFLQTYEQLMLCKYRARPHWGKNSERVFRHPRCHVRDNFPEENFARMLQMQQRHDPGKMFEAPLFKHVLERAGPSYFPRCASAHWCYCEEDVHCPVGDVCRASRAFPDYKICQLDATPTHDEL